MDAKRVNRENGRRVLETKEARKARKEEMQALNDAYEETKKDCRTVMESFIDRLVFRVWLIIVSNFVIFRRPFFPDLRAFQFNKLLTDRYKN